MKILHRFFLAILIIYSVNFNVVHGFEEEAKHYCEKNNLEQINLFQYWLPSLPKELNELMLQYSDDYYYFEEQTLNFDQFLDRHHRRPRHAVLARVGLPGPVIPAMPEGFTISTRQPDRYLAPSWRRGGSSPRRRRLLYFAPIQCNHPGRPASGTCV